MATSDLRRSACVSCGRYCERVRDEESTYRRYTRCKQRRLCDLVDPGLLEWADEPRTLDELSDAHAALLRGSHAMLGALGLQPFPESFPTFLDDLLRAHALLFGEAVPSIAGRFRRDEEHSSFGGNGPNRREGAHADRIREELQLPFKLANRGDWKPVVRAAAFLTTFFRVHPFCDGNGRVGRLMVQRLLRGSGHTISAWPTTGRARRKYVAALEYAHRHQTRGSQALRYLVAWLRPLVIDAPSDVDLDD